MREAIRRRLFLILLAAFGLGLIWLVGRVTRPSASQSARVGPSIGRGSIEPESSIDRVMFVCWDGAGDYGPGVYLHGPAGGGPACLEFVREAAPFMRKPEVGDAAAGLCGYLFKVLGDDVAALGGLSLFSAPRPGPDKVVDWQEYCGWNVDLILIDVERGTAECYSSESLDAGGAKVLIERISGLKFGRP